MICGEGPVRRAIESARLLQPLGVCLGWWGSCGDRSSNSPRSTPAPSKEWNEPGFAKTIYGLGTRRLEDDRTLLWAVMRTATTDEHARAWFRRYWTVGVGSGAHVLVNGLLDVVREDAERRSGSLPNG